MVDMHLQVYLLLVLVVGSVRLFLLQKALETGFDSVDFFIC